MLSTKRVVGKHILTVEGLPDFEKEAFVYAFGVSGSVQCGFCTPGMVMAGKALLDENPDPSEEEIRNAIRGNLCRCTGYRKIIDGIRLAGAILRGEAQIDPDAEKGDDYGVGRRAFRVDVRQKVLGTGKYPDDIDMPGMLHLSAVRSQHARARVLSIDASEALALRSFLAHVPGEALVVLLPVHLQPEDLHVTAVWPAAQDIDKVVPGFVHHKVDMPAPGAVHAFDRPDHPELVTSGLPDLGQILPEFLQTALAEQMGTTPADMARRIPLMADVKLTLTPAQMEEYIGRIAQAAGFGNSPYVLSAEEKKEIYEKLFSL